MCLGQCKGRPTQCCYNRADGAVLRHSSECSVLWPLYRRKDDADVQRFGTSAHTRTLPLVFIGGGGGGLKESEGQL